jgi:hypothetical protein
MWDDSASYSVATARLRNRYIVCLLAKHATDPEVRVRFPGLQDFLKTIGSGTGSTQPREYNLWSYLEEKIVVAV